MNSQSLAAAAHEALKQGKAERARELFGEAARREVFEFLAIDESKPRTKGILAISAASLWYKAGEFEIAEQFAHQASGLSTLPAFARKELRELLQSIWNEQAQKEADVSFGAQQVLVSVKGGEVVTGGAPLDLILGKVQVIQNLFFRTVEYMIDAPLRIKGPAAKEIQDRYRPWLFQSVPGSYQFVVAVQKPTQADLFPGSDIEPELLTKKFLDIVRACGEDPAIGLSEVVSKPEYRQTFLKMTRSLTPSGRKFSQLEIRGAGDAEPVVLSPESRKVISEALRPPTPPSEPQSPEAILRGNLRALHLDKDWLDVAVDGETKRISGLDEALDDLIGPMVNHDVIVRARRGRGKQLLFIDIELED